MAMDAYLPIIPSSVARRTVTEMIGDEIESLITSGVLRIGDKLPSERDLAQMLNVSRETVRRSIEHLVERGVLEKSRGTRTRVVSIRTEKVPLGVTNRRSLSGYSVEDVFKARIDIEKAAISAATANADQEFIENLDRILSAQLKIISEPGKFFVWDRAFHVCIYRQSGNMLLSDIALDLYSHMVEKGRDVIDAGRAAIGYEDHLLIVKAIKSRDPTAAASALQSHIERQMKSRLAIDASLFAG